MEFEEYVLALGLDPSTVSPDQKAGLQVAWRAQRAIPYASAAGGAAPLDIQASVDRYCQMHRSNPEKIKQLRELGERATAEGWDRQATELALLRLDRTAGPFAFAPATNARPEEADAIAVSLAMSAGLSERQVRGWADDRTIDYAMSRPMRGMRLHGLIRACIGSAGGQVPHGQISDSHIREAFKISEAMASGPSTISVSGILSNIANKTLMTSYAGTPTTWARWCHVQTAKDFKELTAYRMTLDGTLMEVAPSGEIKHVSLQEATESNQAKTYGALLGLDRRDIINDDLGAFVQIPAMLGRQASVSLEKAVYTKLLANENSFFHTSNGNYLSGGGSALQLSALQTAANSFAAQLDDNGDPMFLNPALLLVPPILGATGRTLVASQAIIDGTATAAQPAANPWAGMFGVVEAPYLGTAAGLAGASQTGWYLLCGPSDFSPLAVCFLGGNQTPMVQSAEMDFHRLGMQFRVVFDYGIAQHDHRGGVFSAGA